MLRCKREGRGRLKGLCRLELCMDGWIVVFTVYET